MTDFSTLGLIEPIVKAVAEQGFTEPTAIQAQTIPALLEGSDLLGVAQTGGGKTAAFVLPMLQRLAADESRPRPGTPRALILAPTRELASQIGDNIRKFSRGQKLNHTVIFGGAPMRPQMQMLKRGVDILVATPGRLLDHVQRGTVRFDMVDTFILDEADRMLDMGFVDDVTRISKALHPDHQTILFSATMPPMVERFANALLTDPVRVETSPSASVTKQVTHKVCYVLNRNKASLLADILEKPGTDRVLVFTRTKMDADRLSDHLRESEIRADAIHGDKPQFLRQKILRNFRNGRHRVLVATDVAARGIDVPDITHVINYDIPTDPESYVHRIGRTGRAKAEGTAVSFCDFSEVRHLRMIEKVIKQRVDVDEDHDYHAPPRENRGGGKKKGFGNKRPFNKGKGGKPGFAGKGGKPFANKDGSGKNFGGKPHGKPGKPAAGNDAGKGNGEKKPYARKKPSGGYEALKRKVA